MLHLVLTMKSVHHNKTIKRVNEWSLHNQNASMSTYSLEHARM
jgi:hypothetical protein